jgi:hypothetical protein
VNRHAQRAHSESERGLVGANGSEMGESANGMVAEALENSSGANGALRVNMIIAKIRLVKGLLHYHAAVLVRDLRMHVVMKNGIG